MKMELKRTLVLALAVCFLIGNLVGCSGGATANSAASDASPSQAASPSVPDKTEAPTSQQEELSVSTKINMSTASSGSLFYTGGIAVTQLWIEKLDAIASASSSSGSAENVSLLLSGETNMGIIQSNIVMDAYNGVNAYEGNPQTQLRILAPLSSSTYHILARKDANITCLADSRDKRVCIYPAGSGNAVTLACIYGAIGMSTDDVRGSNIALNESIEALKNGSLDMTIVFGQYPNSSIMNALAGSNDLEVVPFSEEEIEKITTVEPWILRDVIPAGTYEGQDEDFPTLTHSGFICVTEDFPEEDAYALVKTMYSNLDWLYETYAALDCYATKNPISTANSIPVPLHNGAARAFESLGLTK